MKTFSGIIIIFSIALQQIALFAFQSFRFTLIDLSWWVISVPVWILWLLYFVTPFIYNRGLDKLSYVKKLALNGWIFVAASGLWISAYIFFSNFYGTPISSGS